MVSIQNLCTRVICLEHGKIIADGKTETIIDYYLNKQQGKSATQFINDKTYKATYIKSFKITSQIKTGLPFNCELEIYSSDKINVECAITICTMENQPIYQIYSGHVGENFKLNTGINTIVVNVEHLPLIHGTYVLNLWLGTSATTYDFHSEAIAIDVFEGAIRPDGPVSSKNGYPVIENAKWNLK